MIGMQCWKVQEKSAVWAVEPSILATESRYRTESGADFMGRIELDFPAGIWEPFATQRPPIRCSAGYLIYLQDTEATCFYFLKSGKVKSFIQSEDGAERVLNVYTAGNLFGEASFFDELPRLSSAVALTPCEIVPIDRELVIACAKKTGRILTVEEHSARGGLGSAVAEVLAESWPVPVSILGAEDFAESGDLDALLEKYGYEAESIALRAQALLRKGR